MKVAAYQAPLCAIGSMEVVDLTFGILICNDSNYYEPARIMAAQGAAALFIPTNNGLPAAKGGPELVTQARNVDIARAIENSVSVIRADVAGRTENLASYGSSLGGASGLLFARWSTSVLLSYLPQQIPLTLELRPDARVLGFTLLVASLTGLLFGLAPALQATRHDLVNSLKDQTGVILRRVRLPLHKSLVVVLRQWECRSSQAANFQRRMHA
jgi:apolipoprotein N-acyltransferase